MSYKWPQSTARTGDAFSRLPEMLTADPAAQMLLRQFIQSVALKGEMKFTNLADVVAASLAGAGGKYPRVQLGTTTGLRSPELELVNLDDEDLFTPHVSEIGGTVSCFTQDTWTEIPMTDEYTSSVSSGYHWDGTGFTVPPTADGHFVMIGFYAYFSEIVWSELS